jgi:hypothetical protein
MPVRVRPRANYLSIGVKGRPPLTALLTCKSLCNIGFLVSRPKTAEDAKSTKNDPIGEREVARALRGATFKTVAEEWLASRAEQYAKVTMSKALWILETFIYPCIGGRPISVITAPELLAALKPIERQGMRETAHRAMQKCGQIFRYAVASGCAERDITVDLRGVLNPSHGGPGKSQCNYAVFRYVLFLQTQHDGLRDSPQCLFPQTSAARRSVRSGSTRREHCRTNNVLRCLQCKGNRQIQGVWIHSSQ